MSGGDVIERQTTPKKTEDLTDEELALAEDSINHYIEKDVNLNFVQYFLGNYPHTYEDFLHIRDICRSGGFELHKPVNISATELCISLEALHQLFGQKAKFVNNLKNENMEQFRRQLLRYYNIVFCRCGCTALNIDLEKSQKIKLTWTKFVQETVKQICEGQSQSNNLKCKRHLQAVQFLRDIEENEETNSCFPCEPTKQPVPQSPSLINSPHSPDADPDTDYNGNPFTIDSQQIVVD